MLKRIVLASALSVLFTGGTLAQSLGNYAECVRSTMDLSKAAEAKQMPDEQIDRVEELLDKMEEHCANKRFSDATALLQQVKAMIEKL
jgi:non-homologous end joining protein Ku